jgi:hypothetical protein
MLQMINKLLISYVTNIENMPTIDPVKNLECVKKSQIKKREALGADAYNKINADIEPKHSDNLKAKLDKMDITDNKRNT